MNILYKLLQDRCDEIRIEGENKEKIKKVIEAFYRVLDFEKVARNEGFLALEEKMGSLDQNDPAQVLFFSQLII